MFREQAMDRFRNPRDAGELKDYNGKGKAGDPECSDMVEMYVRFEKGTVADAKFKVFGCPGAVSTTDVFIGMIKGKNIADALKINESHISDALGGLPIDSMQCANLPIESFRKDVNDFKGTGKNV